jgi:uncharacterized damage-inducible protein DinB
VAIPLIAGLYDYHRWANRRLADVAVARGTEVVERAMGPEWSFPTIRAMFTHIYGADALWLARWKGTSLTEIPGGDIGSMDLLRERWKTLENEQAAFVDALTDADAGRVIEYKNTQGQPFRAPLGSLLQHVVNHATHHRSEIATMLTLAGGSPPDTGINTFLVAPSGRA